MGRLVALIRERLGLSNPAELAKVDARIVERERRLRAIDERIRGEIAGDPRLRKRRATDQ